MFYAFFYVKGNGLLMMTRQIMGMLQYVFCRISADIHFGLATQQQKKKEKKKAVQFPEHFVQRKNNNLWLASIVSAVTKFRAGDWLNSHITDEKKF